MSTTTTPPRQVGAEYLPSMLRFSRNSTKAALLWFKLMPVTLISMGTCSNLFPWQSWFVRGTFRKLPRRIPKPGPPPMASGANGSKVNPVFRPQTPILGGRVATAFEMRPRRQQTSQRPRQRALRWFQRPNGRGYSVAKARSKIPS